MLPVQFLCTRVRAPTVKDDEKLEQVLGYLKMTKSWTISFDNSPFERVEMHIDVSFTTHGDRKSQSGCMVMLGGTLVHEKCRKQKIVAKSSMEAELVALSDHIIETELIKDILMELGHMMGEDLVTNVHIVRQKR